MLKLFGALLRRESNGDYFLITPKIKYPITVEDAPFQAVELRRQGSGKTQTLFFRTNLDEIIRADKTHPLQITNPQKPTPYLTTNNNLKSQTNPRGLL